MRPKPNFAPKPCKINFEDGTHIDALFIERKSDRIKFHEIRIEEQRTVMIGRTRTLPLISGTKKNKKEIFITSIIMTK